MTLFLDGGKAPEEQRAYLGGNMCANGSPREAEPIMSWEQWERFCDVARSAPDLSRRIFSGGFSYLEKIELVGLNRMDWEMREFCRAVSGYLPQERVLSTDTKHPRKNGSDIHTLILPIDLLTGLTLPLFPRDKTCVELIEKLQELWDLQENRASPHDYFRRRLSSPALRNVSGEVSEWFRATDACLVDWLRAGLIRSRSDLIAGLEAAGATIKRTFYTKIIIIYANNKIVLRGGKYSAKFPYDTISGCAGAPHKRNPASYDRRNEELGEKISELRARRAASFGRFRRHENLTNPRGFSSRVTKYVRTQQAADGSMFFGYADGISTGIGSDENMLRGKPPTLASDDTSPRLGVGRIPADLGRSEHPKKHIRITKDESCCRITNQGNGGNPAGFGSEPSRSPELAFSDTEDASILRPGRIGLGSGRSEDTARGPKSPGIVSVGPSAALTREDDDPEAPTCTDWIDHYLAAESERKKYEHEIKERKRIARECLESHERVAAGSASELRKISERLHEFISSLSARTRSTCFSIERLAREKLSGDGIPLQNARRPLNAARGQQYPDRARITSLLGELAATRENNNRALSELNPQITRMPLMEGAAEPRYVRPRAMEVDL